VTHRTGRRPAGGLLGTLAVALVAAVVISGRGTAAGGDAPVRVGALRISGASLPRPASRDVASVYLTIRNDGDLPDTVRRLSSDAAAEVTVMTEQPGGRMADTGPLVVPAHVSVQLQPGRQHLMLASPRAGLREGAVVHLTLDFDRAGPVVLAVPVTAVGGTR